MKLLFNKLSQLSVRLQVEKGELKIKAPKGVLTPEIIAEIKTHKSDLIALLSGSELVIPKVATQESYPLTSAQKRMWILHQLQGNSSAYTIPISFEVSGNLEVRVLEKAFQHLIIRHESLRTYFKEQTNQDIQQYILPETEVRFELETVKTDEDSAIIAIEKLYNHKFLLFEAPLWLTKVFRLSENRYIISLVMHHIISDGWSIEIFIKDLLRSYDCLQRGKTIDLAPLAIQYKDYAVWNQEQREGKSFEAAGDYWKTQFSGELPKPIWPTFQTRPKIKTFNGATLTHHFSEEFTTTLEAFTIKQDISLFMLLMASINILCYKYTNATDIILGTPMANRDRSELELQIGLYLNTLAIRTTFEPTQSVQELLIKQKEILLEGYANQIYPFDELVDALTLSRDMSRSPLFDVMVVLHNQQNLANQKEQKLDGLVLKPYQKLDKKSSQFDFTFAFFKSKNIQLQLSYNTDIYEEFQVKKLLTHLENILSEMVKNPKQKIEEIHYLSTTETNQLLYDFNATELAYNQKETILNLFESQVATTPDAIALVFEEKELTYNELNEKANQLASYLTSLDVKQQQVIALCVDRSVEMMIGILGILKSGNSYLPIDSSHPEERIQYILEDSNARVVLTKKEITTFIDFNEKSTIVCLDDTQIWKTKISNHTTPISFKTAYVIYTSGTTGKPKGVSISHQNVLNFFLALNQEFGIPKPKDTWLAVTNISFDISILELLWTLTRGNKVVIQPDRPIVTQTTDATEFSLFYFAAQDVQSQQNKYKLLIEGAEMADAFDFKAVWVPERHFHAFGDPYPNPSIAAAALAVKTKNVKIRSGSVVLPLHDPIRIAEEWSMVDNLSNGRVELSIASGWNPNDFVLAPENYKERHRIMRENTETLISLWKGETIRRINGVGTEIDIKIHPKPIQENLKIWITAAGSKDTFEYAGKIGANILTHLLGQNTEELQEKIQHYRDTLTASGFDADKGKVALMLHTFVSTDENYVRETVEIPFKNYLKQSINLIKPLAEAANLDMEKDMETVIDMAFQRYYKTSGLFGTPESCFHIIKKMNAIGIDEIACLIDYGIKESIVLDNLKHVSRLDKLVKKHQRKATYFAKRLQKKWSIPELIEKHQVNQMQSTPSLIQEILLTEGGEKALQQIETLLVGGEALPTALANTLLDVRKKPVYNMYGPTETTIWSSYKKINIKDEVTIGKPLANTCMYVLNTTNKLCSIGVIGELCIGGDGVSGGYLGLEDLNQTKFIENPFATKNQFPTLYCTGDFARWLPTGELECLGRIDNQVKIHGHRIEVAEIENVLNQFSSITQTVVVYNERIQDLVVYLLTKPEYEEEALRNYVSTKLPSYMLPNHYYKLEEFPLNQNGKIDRKTLATREITQYITSQYDAPRNDLDAQLIEIWEEILSISNIGITQNFFELGGNSLKGMFLVNKLNEDFDIELNLFDMFSHTEIKSLSNLIQNLIDNINPTYVNEIII